jgi:hypothetical protein
VGAILRIAKNLKIEILCERLTGNIVDKFVNQAMEWGVEKEPEAKKQYELKTGRLIKDVGFVDHPKIEFCGASPDGLVDDGLDRNQMPDYRHLPKLDSCGSRPRRSQAADDPCNAPVRVGPLWILWRMTQGCQRHRGCL